MNKYAIVNILYGTGTYLIGACINAQVHKKFRHKYNLNFDIVLMVDANLYVYKDILELFYDKIMLIDMISVKLNENYKKIIHKRYTNTMHLYSTKYNFFKFIEYDKILLVDIDILPVDKKFYNCFNSNTPASAINTINIIDKKNNKDSYDMKDFFNKDLENVKDTDLPIISNNIRRHINGGLILISPKKDDFDNMIKFIKLAENGNGYSSGNKGAAVDETILMLYYLYFKKEKIYPLDPNITCVPWFGKPNNEYSINYLSTIKPWNKPMIFMHKEEFIYKYLINNVIKKHKLLKIIHLLNIAKTIYNYNKNIDSLSNRCIKNDNLKQICHNNILKVHNIDDTILQTSNREKYENMSIKIENKLDKIWRNMNKKKYILNFNFGSVESMVNKLIEVFKK
jgi:hypothetical protein